MRITVVGGGPGGLSFALLARRRLPEAEVHVVERHPPAATYGFGVVFSDETLNNFQAAAPDVYDRFEREFRSWREIETYVGGECVVSTGHGFAAMPRGRLLELLAEACREEGVELEYGREVENLAEVDSADLVVAADGLNSRLREERAEHFGPTIHHGACRFCWLGTDLPLEAFTFIFKKSEWGLFQIHAYPYDEQYATWIVECQEETFRKTGLDPQDEAATAAFVAELFAEELDGHELLTNRSIWRRFPTLMCETWIGERLALLGDSAHTAHFSIGSGTKLAMEDAIALAEALAAHPREIPAALEAYQEERWVEVLKAQKGATTSREWFERAERFLQQTPLQFTFNLLSRSKQISYDELQKRDPALVERVDVAYPCWAGVSPGGLRDAPPIFQPFTARGLELTNRVVVSPMCQYSAREGCPNDWHLVHLGTRALGGAGLIITEMTDVEPEGRITYGCTGLWNDEHVAAWRRIVEFVHANSRAGIGIQLAHAGRKGSVRHPWEGPDLPLAPDEGAWETLAPSAIPFDEGWHIPKEMDRADMDQVVAAFERAARLAHEAGFDLIELHMAHGYLLSQFLSPLTNRRTDEYGGTLERRMRFPLEVFAAMRAVWPEVKPIFVRLTGWDWFEDGRGMTPDDAVAASRALKQAGCDVIDVSSGGNVPDSPVVYGRMYQAPLAEKVRYEARIPTATVGALLGADHANTVLAAGRADLAVMARPHLRDPYLTLRAAEEYGLPEPAWPGQYVLGRPPEKERGSRRGQDE